MKCCPENVVVHSLTPMHADLLCTETLTHRSVHSCSFWNAMAVDLSSQQFQTPPSGLDKNGWDTRRPRDVQYFHPRLPFWDIKCAANVMPPDVPYSYRFLEVDLLGDDYRESMKQRMEVSCLPIRQCLEYQSGHNVDMLVRGLFCCMCCFHGIIDI